MDWKEKSLHERANMISSAKEEGIQEGIQEGELKKAIEIAKKLLDIGMAVEVISKTTGLSIEEIKDLKH